jgi:rhamnosyltransferase
MNGGARVGCVVPVFRPGADLPAGVASVLQQVDDVVLVLDEADPAPATELLLEQCVAEGARLVRHAANLGIGAALNSGLRALDGQPDFVLTLDQDSRLEDGYVAELVAAHRVADHHGVRVGMVAPAVVESIGRMSARQEGAVLVGGEPIQSGLLVPRAVLEDVGDFDDTLFIDGVDTDFYLRALDAGYTCVVAPATRIGHRLGDAHAGPVRRGPALVVAADFRYFYQWRNLVRLLRRHARKHPGWAAHAVWKAVRHLGIVTVLVPGRGPRLSAAAAGLRAGVAGREGRAEA